MVARNKDGKCVGIVHPTFVVGTTAYAIVLARSGTQILAHLTSRDDDKGFVCTDRPLAEWLHTPRDAVVLERPSMSMTSAEYASFTIDTVTLQALLARPSVGVCVASHNHVGVESFLLSRELMDGLDSLTAMFDTPADEALCCCHGHKVDILSAIHIQTMQKGAAPTFITCTHEYCTQVFPIALLDDLGLLCSIAKGYLDDNTPAAENVAPIVPYSSCSATAHDSSNDDGSAWLYTEF
jgi:hypothetical protein